MSSDRAHSAWKSAETIKKLSDRVVGLGPFSIGLDGLLTWIPGAGVVYSAGAGLYLLYLGFSTGASFSTLARMAGYLGIDTILSGASDVALPVVGDVVDMFWQGHLLAANALQKDIEGRHGVPPSHVAAVERERRRRGRGLGWIGILLLIVLGVSVWISDFWETRHLGWWPAFRDASLTVNGYTVALPVAAGVLIVLMFLLNIVNRAPRKA